jgi:hypothetical protein
MIQSRLHDSFLKVGGWTPPDTVIASACGKSLAGFQDLWIIGLQIEIRDASLHNRHPVLHIPIVVETALLVKV